MISSARSWLRCARRSALRHELFAEGGLGPDGGPGWTAAARQLMPVPRRRLLVLGLGAATLIAAIIIAASWVIGGLLMAPAPRAIGQIPGDLAGEAVSFPSASGATISGWFVPGLPHHGAVLLLHGVRGSRLDMIGRARFLSRDGCALLLFDFASHGASSGAAITFGYREAADADAALAFLAQRSPGERIGAVACSMGAAALVLSATGNAVQAMVLESMYPTISDAVSDRIAHRLGSWSRILAPLLTWQLRPRLGFGPEALRPIDAVATLTMPKLFLAGAADPLTPLSETEGIVAQAADPKELWIIPAAGHVDLHAWAAGAYEARLLTFLHAALRPRPAAELESPPRGRWCARAIPPGDLRGAIQQRSEAGSAKADR